MTQSSTIDPSLPSESSVAQADPIGRMQSLAGATPEDPAQHHHQTESLGDYDALVERGQFRHTPQRRQVFQALLEQRDHPTAAEVFMRLKLRMPSLSLATVYNCLETLRASGLVKHVAVERGPARYCPNLHPHAHFFCTSCNQVIDIAGESETAMLAHWNRPEGARVSSLDVTLHGLCPTCSSRQSPVFAAVTSPANASS